jgi:hypothetical protein
MPHDREDFEKVSEMTRMPAKDDTSRLRAIQQQAVHADQLTGDPSWDKYLSYVQAQIDQAKKNRADFMGRLASPQMVNADQISLVRNSIIRLDQMIATLEWAIALPNQIKRLGEVAKEHLDSLAAIELKHGDAA